MEETKMVRAFLALDPDDAARQHLSDQLRQLQNTSWAKHIKWDSVHKFHLTVRFLGNVSQTQLDDLVQKLGVEMRMIDGIQSLQLRLTEPRLFPNPHFPRVIACGVERNPALRQLARLCERLAVEIGCAGEKRDFNAHITFGRMRDSWQRGTQIHFDSQRATMTPSELTLYKSDLTPKGAIYTVLHRFRLDNAQRHDD